MNEKRLRWSRHVQWRLPIKRTDRIGVGGMTRIRGRLEQIWNKVVKT